MSQLTTAAALPAINDHNTLHLLWQEFSGLPAEVRAHYFDRAEGRFDIKTYQLESTALTALKESAINGTAMGGGKTRMALMHAYATKSKRTFVTLPVRLMSTWRDECAALNIPCFQIRTSSDARRVRRLFWERRQNKQEVKEFEVYLISWEWLCLGGNSNKAYDPWYASMSITGMGQTAVEVLERVAADPLFNQTGGYNRDAIIKAFLASLTKDLLSTIEPIAERCYEDIQAEKAEKENRLQSFKNAAAVLRPVRSPIEIDSSEELSDQDEAKITESLESMKGPDVIKSLMVMLTIAADHNDQCKVAREMKEPSPMALVDFSPLYTSVEKETKDGSVTTPTYRVKVLCETETVKKFVDQLRKDGFPISKGQPYRYEAHHSNCPKCDAAVPMWRGDHCRECHYDPRCYRRKPVVQVVRSKQQPHGEIFVGKKASNESFPGYKLLPKTDLLIVEEFHKAVSLRTHHGKALFNLDADRSLLLSGTICRNYITELQPALAMVHDQNSPEFPYARHDLSDFDERFSSFVMTNRMSYSRTGRLRNIRSRRQIPEASNVNALRRLLAGRLVAVDESIINAQWNLTDTPESTAAFNLLPGEAELYNETLSDVLSWRDRLLHAMEHGTRDERLAAQRALLRGARNRIDLVTAIVNGPSKIIAAVDWVRRECYQHSHRAMVVCRSVDLYKRLEKAFREAGFSFDALDDKVSNDDRHEFLDNFRDGGKKILLTRIKLVCEGFNQLVCVNRTLMCEVERNVSDNRQLAKRMNRPGQTKQIRLDYLVARLPNGVASVDEVEIRHFIRKDRAIKEITSSQARFRGAAQLLQSAQEKRGLLVVLDDLANRVISEAPAEARAQPDVSVPVALPPTQDVAVSVEPTVPVAEVSVDLQVPATPPVALPSTNVATTDRGGVSHEIQQDLFADFEIPIATTQAKRRRLIVNNEQRRFVQDSLGF